MKSLIILANIRAKAGSENDLRKHLESLTEFARQQPGCLQYDLHQDDKEPEAFFIYENWQTREDWQTHAKGQHIVDYVEATEGLVDGFTVQEMSRIA